MGKFKSKDALENNGDSGGKQWRGGWELNKLTLVSQPVYQRKPGKEIAKNSPARVREASNLPQTLSLQRGLELIE